jgi:hypothetical protein
MKRKTKTATVDQKPNDQDKQIREVTDALLNAIVGGNAVRVNCKCH